MTREERALTHLRRHVPDAAKLLQIGSPGGECWVLDFAIAFADAEAAAMRERAADYLEGYAGGHHMAKSCAAAIRALPATGEVGRG